ncbi:MAG: LacI family DNA-binding transcriptional regulator [Actinobacteria bacterium]|nr:LacI family DNA-binding transcriptional regulator [Actinomycetota bacterium]
MSTLRDVARHAGVSVATASRVARGSVVVKADTRERVERSMRELLYVPPGRVRATGVIGLLLPNFENPIFPTIAQALQARTAAIGYASILCTTESAAFREVEYVHMLLDRQVDGMIFVSCEMTNLSGEHDHYARLIDDGARIVFVNGALNRLDIPSVGVDERSAAEVATQHLLDLGHVHIGYASGPDFYLPAREKEVGWRAALIAAGITPDGRITHQDFTVEGGLRAGRALLRLDPRPTGIICSNDLMAIGVLRAAADAGIRVPDDLSVVGFDGIEAASWTNPPLTTIEQPIAEIAQTAVDTLRTLIEHPKALPNSYFRPYLRVRSSTGPPPK